MNQAKFIFLILIMINFRKYFKFKFLIILILFLLFIGDSISYATPINNYVNELRPPIGRFDRLLEVAGYYSSNGLPLTTRRSFVEVLSFAPFTERFFAGVRQNTPNSELFISEESIALRVVEALASVANQMDHVANFQAVDFSDWRTWKIEYYDLIDDDLKRLAGFYNQYANTAGANKRNINDPNMLRTIIKLIREDYEKKVAERSPEKIYFSELNCFYRIIPSDETVNYKGAQVLFIELPVVGRSWFDGYSNSRIMMGNKPVKVIAVVRNETQVLIDEVIFPALNSGTRIAKLLKAHGPLSDQNTERFVRTIIKNRFSGMSSRKEIGSVIDRNIILHENAHLERSSLDRTRIENRLRQSFSEQNIKDLGFENFEQLISEVTGELNSFLAELEGEYPEIFLTKASIVTNSLLAGGIKYSKIKEFASYIAFSIIAESMIDNLIPGQTNPADMFSFLLQPKEKIELGGLRSCFKELAKLSSKDGAVQIKTLLNEQAYLVRQFYSFSSMLSDGNTLAYNNRNNL